MRIDIKVDTKAANAAFIALGREAHTAVGRSLDRTIVGVRQLATDMTLAELNLKATAVKKRMSIRRAHGTLEAAVTIAAKPSPLLDFKGTTFAKKSRRGVSFRPKRGGPRIRLAHAFILQLKSGPRVFERARVGGRFVARLPVKALTSTFVSQFISGTRQLGALRKYAERRFTKELASELLFRLKRRSGAL